MDGGELNKILGSDSLISIYYRGIFSSDDLEYPLRKNGIWIVNLAKTSEEYGHWLCIHTLRADNVCEYLCSAYTNYKNFPHIQNCIKSFTSKVYSFPARTQDVDGTSCAIHSLFNAWCCSRKIFGKEIFERFFEGFVESQKLFKGEVCLLIAVKKFFNLKYGVLEKHVFNVSFLKGQQAEMARKDKNRKK